MNRSALALGVLCLTLLSGGAAAAPPVIVPPRRLDASEVPYPARGKGDATVVITLVVDASGEVSDVTVREGAAPFDAAAIDAVRSWRFAPATRDDVPIVARITATVVFHAPAPPPVAAAPAVVPPESTLEPPPPGEIPTLDVSVKGQREEPSTLHLPRTEARLVPGTFGDPFKIIEALPGTAPWLSGLPYYYVRGSPPESVGYFVDGIRVPLLFHVGPGPSTLAPALVDSVDLFPAAYPARYGRFSGAVIAGETAPPVTDRAHGEFSARIYDASAFAETPFDAGKGSLMAASRYSYTGPLISLVVPNYSLDYWDYQLRASHTVGDAGTLAVFAFGAHDELHYYGQPTFRIEYHRVDLRFDHPVAGGNVRVAFTLNYDDTLTAVETDTGAGATAAQKGPGGRLRAEVDERVSDTARVRAGADVLATQYTVDQYPPFDGFPGIQGPHSDVEGGVYADVVWRPTRELEVVPGFRFDGYETRQNTTWAPQPRLGARLRIVPWLTSITALGTAHQEPTEQVFVPAKIPNAVDQGSQTNYQFSQGLEARLPSSIRARVTGFYSHLVSEHILGTDASETGESGGLEVFLHRDFSQRLGGMISYTLSRTVGTAGGVTQRVSWDRTHMVSVVAGYDLGRSWRIGARVFIESGRPYPPVCVRNCGPSAPASAAVSYTPAGDLPPFWRVDARLEKRWNFAGGQWITGALECFNVLDKAEPIGDELGAGGAIVVRDQSPIILPTIGVEGGF
jgi:TonB family protein